MTKMNKENNQIERKWGNSFHDKELNQWSTKVSEGIVKELLSIKEIKSLIIDLFTISLGCS